MTHNISNLSARSFKTGCHVYSRVGHRTLLKDTNILVFGGINFHNDFVTEALNINCESYQVTPLITKNSIPLEGFSLHQYQSKIYLWGGRRPSGPSDELWKFQNQIYTKITQKGNIPKPRFNQCSTLFAKKYMIIYGGISDQAIFEDWFCLNLDDFTWSKIYCDYNLPQNFQPKMVWLETRGILIISQIWDHLQNRKEYCCKLFEFKFRKKQNGFRVLVEEMQIQFKQPMQHRGLPTVCKYQTDSLCLAIIGGERFQEGQSQLNHKMSSDVWIINLETLQGKKAQEAKLTTKYGHQAIFYKDRILLVGGVISVNEFSCNLQTIDLKLKMISIDRKLCQACQGVYGLQDYNKSKILIKCQYQSNPKSYIPVKLAKKFAEVIRNPIKAFGLLIDNSLNMNANLVEINFRKMKLDERIFSPSSCMILELSDNSYGFNKEEILQSFYTFGYKIQTFTHDSKFEQQLAVRKQYGLNLKLASLRLGRACLIISNTIDNQKFIGYFSTDLRDCPEFKDRFTCFYYFINKQKGISSQINRNIILNNINHLISIDQIQNRVQSQTKIFIIDFNMKNQFSFVQENTNIVCQQFEEQGFAFMNLKHYLTHLYLKPYCGRSIKLSNNDIYCENLLDYFKRDEVNHQIRRINLMPIFEQTSHFEQIILYEVLNKQYKNRSIIIYSCNRLICSLNFSQEMVCGIIQLMSDVEIGVGKCGISNQIQEKQIKKYILKLIDQSLKTKRHHASLRDMEQDSISILSKSTKKNKIK